MSAPLVPVFIGLVLDANFGKEILLGVIGPRTTSAEAEGALRYYMARDGVPESAYGIVVQALGIVHPDPKPCPVCGQTKPHERAPAQ